MDSWYRMSAEAVHMDKRACCPNSREAENLTSAKLEHFASSAFAATLDIAAVSKAGSFEESLVGLVEDIDSSELIAWNFEDT